MSERGKVAPRRKIMRGEPVPVVRIRITVDPELAEIIRHMQEDDMTNRAIRRYARKFLGLPEPAWAVTYRKRYQR